MLFFLFRQKDGLCTKIEPLYQDPFDIASGGASLTRATQEGMLASNPALLPYGGKIFRWLGMKTIIAPGKESIQLVNTLGKSSESNNDTFVNNLFAKPIHLGVTESLSFITNNVGIAAVTSVSPDIRAWKRGDASYGAGTPNIIVQNESYAGMYASAAYRSLKWLSFGITGKYFYINDTKEVIEVLDQNAVANVQKKMASVNPTTTGQAMGFDFASLFFLQGKYIDFRIATVAANLGGMQVKGEDTQPQMLHAGIGLTFHGENDAIHFSFDMRDIQSAYPKEETFKKIYMGTKVVLFGHLGFACGLYQLSPTYGVELDLFLLRLGVSTYIKEYEDRPSVDRRQIYLVTVSLGWDF